MWEDLLRAFALLLIVEGVMPFLSPAAFRRTLLSIAATEDRWLRLLGLAGMIVGLALLNA